MTDNEIRNLIININNQLRKGTHHYNRFAEATQKYTLLLHQLKTVAPSAYEEFKKEMEQRFGGPLNEQNNQAAQEGSAPSTTEVGGSEARSGEGADQSSADVSNTGDSQGAGDGSGEVRGAELATGSGVESGS